MRFSGRDRDRGAEPAGKGLVSKAKRRAGLAAWSSRRWAGSDLAPGNGRSRPAGHCGTSSTSSTGCGLAGRVNAEDPAYAETSGNPGVPDPPRKPFPPRYLPARRISGRPGSRC